MSIISETFWNREESTTGWFIMTDKKYELFAQAKKQPLSWDICPFHHYIGTFWYLVFKKFHDHPVIIHLERLLKYGNYWKVRIVLQIYPRGNLASSWNILWWSITIFWAYVFNTIKIHSQMRAHMSTMCAFAIKRAQVRLQHMHAHLYPNLQKIWNLSSQDSNWSTIFADFKVTMNPFEGLLGIFCIWEVF